MRKDGRAAASRLVALLIALLIHIVFLGLLLHFKSEARLVSNQGHAVGTLRFLDESRPETPANTMGPHPPLPVKLAPIAVADIPLPRVITAPEQSSAPADWWSDARVAAELQTRRHESSETRNLAGPPASASRKCAKAPTFKWDPEPKRAGFSGMLPFVRIGKRCVVGLGFFGCGIGKLPEDNGQLFEGMGDPAAEQGSVPDIDCEPDGSPAPP